MSPEPEDRVGTTLADRYALLRILGRGGMGVVYEAEHALSSRRVAVKMLVGDGLFDDDAHQRFLREARAAGRIDHPNVVEILDVGLDEGGTPFMVLELFKGESLEQYLDRSGMLSPERTLELVLPILDGVASAHDHNIIHRDLKPDNIFLSHVGAEVTPKLLDFGIAKTDDALRTRTGVVMGTPAYMSPEQARGETPLGPATDQWAIGVILFEALTGRRPFEADSFAVLVGRILTAPVPSVLEHAPEVPAVIAACVDRTLQKRPEDRFPSVMDLASALRAAADEAGLVLGMSGRARISWHSERPPAPASKTVDPEQETLASDAHRAAARGSAPEDVAHAATQGRGLGSPPTGAERAPHQDRSPGPQLGGDRADPNSRADGGSRASRSQRSA